MVHPKRSLSIIAKLTLALQRWTALRQLPRGVSKEPYLFFDYFVVFGGSHERVMIYQDHGHTTLSFRENDSDVKQRNITIELSPVHLDDLFSWLKELFSNGTEMFQVMADRDPVRLRFFACDADHDWVCSIGVNDVRRCKELQGFRYKFMERINRYLLESNAEC